MTLGDVILILQNLKNRHADLSQDERMALNLVIEKLVNEVMHK